LEGCIVASELGGADFRNANLELSTISGKVSDTHFEGAELAFSVWVGADLARPRDVQAAKDWALAFYKPADLAILGLPTDHNQKLFNFLQARIPNAKIQERVRLTIVLQSIQKLFGILQDAKDKISDDLNKNQQTK
jgi:uncharacterized protein YjbI with pentapeptide repeats